MMSSNEVQEKLHELRRTIKENAPLAIEKISWRMPTFYLNGNLIHFAVFKSHIGLYPGASGVTHFQDKLIHYKTYKGGIQLPINQPLPVDLIKEIVQFMIEENTKKQ